MAKSEKPHQTLIVWWGSYVVGVLIEVPVMLMLVKIANNSKDGLLRAKSSIFEKKYDYL